MLSNFVFYVLLFIVPASAKFFTHAGHNYPFKNETIIDDRYGNILLKTIVVPVPLATIAKVIDMNNEAVFVGITSNTIRGKANRELMEHIAKVLSIHLIYVSLLEGERYKCKTLMIPDGIVELDFVKRRLREDMISGYLQNSPNFKPRNIVIDKTGNVLIRCTVIPMAKFNKVSEINDHGVMFDVTSDSVDGETNKILTEFLADLLVIPVSDIMIIQGLHEACKTIMIDKEAVTLEEVKEVLEEDARKEI